MAKGKLIVIEGACDGIGKTTQFELLKRKLLEDDCNVASHHFPSYDTEQGKLVENYLSGKYGQIKELTPYFVNSLYAVDRAITWETELKSLYDEGSTILLDRYTTSSLIYQSALIENLDDKKKFIDFVIDFEYNKLGVRKPDVVIFLYASFDFVSRMRKERKTNEGVINDIHEKDLDFMKKVYNNAMFISDYLGWIKIKCDNEDSMRSIESIHKDICNVLE